MYSDQCAHMKATSSDLLAGAIGNRLKPIATAYSRPQSAEAVHVQNRSNNAKHPALHQSAKTTSPH